MSRATFALHYIKRNSVKRKRSALSGKNGWIWVFPSLKSRSPSSAIELGRRIDNGRTSILSIPGLHTREGSSHLRPSRWCRRELILPRWIFQKSLPLKFRQIWFSDPILSRRSFFQLNEIIQIWFDAFDNSVEINFKIYICHFPGLS